MTAISRPINRSPLQMKCTSVRALQHVALSADGSDVGTGLGELATHTPDPELLTLPKLEFAGGDTTVFVTHIDQVDQMYGQLEEV